MKNKAFTIIELLVVIAVIGLLSSIVLVTLKGAKASANDARRKAEIAQIEKALLVYYNSFGEGEFPGEACLDSSKGSDNCNCGPCGAGIGSCTGNDWCHTSQIWQKIVNNGIASFLPVDPINNSTYYYYYEPDCNQGPCVGKGCCKYRICANRLETTGSSYCLEGQPGD